MSRSRRTAAAKLLCGAVVTATAMLPATSAQAAVDLSCEASAVSIGVLGQEPLKPVTAGAPDGCPTESGAPTLELPDLLSATTLIAETGVGGDAKNPSGAAGSGLLSARVSLLPETLPLVTSTVDSAIQTTIAAVPPLTVPLDLTLLDPLGLLGLPSSLSVDLRDGLTKLAPTTFSGELVSADALYSAAAARCVGGDLSVTGDSVITNLRVLGQPVSADEPLTRELGLLNTTSIDPSDIDLADLDITGLPLTTQLSSLLAPTLQAALDALPTVEIPQQLLLLRLTPRQRAEADGAVALRALRVEASLLGQSVLDLGIADATIAATGACPRGGTAGSLEPGGAAPPTADQEILACTDRKLHLIDVYERAGRVRLRGVAHTRYAGRRVSIRSAWNGDVVARPRVRRNGSFSAAAKLPPQRLRYTNRARYRAQAGNERSLNLKLHRRMRVVAVDASRRRAVITGRVTLPLTRPVATIELRRQVDCRKGSARYRLVKRITPRSDGTFRVSVRRPGKARTAVYRFATRVRPSSGGRGVEQTFTLPIGVDFR